MKQNVLAPSSVIVHSESKEQDFSNIQFNIDKKSFATTSEYIYYLTHNVNNIRHNNGRIYFSMKEGVLCANSVSPYSDNFWDNIEEKIKPLVKIINSKRYLTYSSCEGHGMDFRRYIGLAFCDEDTRAYVEQYIKGLNIKGVSTRLYDCVSNNVVETHNVTGKPIPTKKNEVVVQNKENEVQSFNIQFHRNYYDYYFMEIVIYDEISYDYQGVINEVKKIYKRIIKKKNLEKSTSELVKGLSSSDFRAYKY